MVTDAGTKTGCSQTSRGLIRKNGIKVRGRPEPLVHRGPLLAGLQASAALRGSLAGLREGLSCSLRSPLGQLLQKSGVTSLTSLRG